VNGSYLASGDGYLWVADPAFDYIQKINPLNGNVLAKIPVGKSPQAMLYQGGNLWVMNEEDSTLQRISLRSLELISKVFGKFP